MTKPQHVKRRSVLTRAMLIGAAVVVVAGGGVAIAYVVTSSSTSPSASAAATGGGVTTTVKGVSLVVDPADGSTNVALDSVVSVTATDGRLVSVAVMTPSGQAMAGALDPTGLSWRSSGKLLPKTSYTVTVQATTAKGKPSQQVSHFDSMPPTATLTASIFPNTGLTVGIGQPIVLRFNHSVVNKTDLLAQLHVTESTPVTGGWYWFSDRELHFRPQVYWPSGEQVSLTANLTNFDAGGGIYGTADSSTKFTVGDAHISTANVQTHTMTVTSNG
ncbi:MAG: Ig-like domain-containing protein, partial [Actinomycetota bacterium]|nr:Ig-like domain-containing protein [Actinomycetota bacterium]